MFVKLKMAAQVVAAAVMLIGFLGVESGHVSASETGVSVENAFARARPSSAKIGGAFLTVVNKSAEDDVLLSASSSVAKRTELHAHMMKEGVMSMSQVESIAIPAGESVSLEPGGYHVMMMGLTQPLTKGLHFKVTLTFKNAGQVEVMVPVMAAGAMKGMKHTQ